MKRIKTRVWARVIKNFSGIGLLRATYGYLFTPAIGWAVFIAILFAILAIATIIIMKGETPPVALL